MSPNPLLDTHPLTPVPVNLIEQRQLIPREALDGVLLTKRHVPKGNPFSCARPFPKTTDQFASRLT
jgi:hypothetical protein